MSVLNDISVQDGMAIRSLAMGVSNTKARSFLKIVGRFKAHRMDQAEFGIDINDDKRNMIELANAHWVDESGEANWGLPKGSWSDYCERVRKTKQFWKDDVYLPTTATVVSEGLSRDLLLATYMFPFHAKERFADAITEEILMPIMKHLNPAKTHLGSRAVFRIVRDVGAGKLSDIEPFTRNLDATAPYSSFTDFSTALSTITSPCFNDTEHAIKRARNVDWDMAKGGDAFLNIAGMANFVEAKMNMAHRRSKIHKAAKTFASDREDEEECMLAAKMNDGYYEPEDIDEEVYHGFLKGKGKYSFRVTEDSGFRCVASSRVAIVRMNNHFYVLTREDLKSLKFASMSHSMWHVYAGTIQIEYSDTVKVVEAVDLLSDAEKSMVEAAERLARSAEEIVEQVGFATGKHNRQEVVDYHIVKSSLTDLWKWYMRVMTAAVESGHHDCFGKYMSEVFSVYTAKLGGDLMAGTINSMVSEIVSTFEWRGFSVISDISSLQSIFARLPASAIHDFGRLQKIIPAYDVNPIHSFITRCSKMQQPNDWGKARMVSDFEAEIDPMTPAEREMSMNKLKSAARVMLAVGDIKNRALDALTADEKEAFQDKPYAIVMAKLTAMARNVSTAVRLAPVATLDMPAGMEADARAQAKKLVETGEMPVNEYSGAFLDVTATLAYQERGEPDMAILKATSIVSGKVRVAMSNLSGCPRATPTRKGDGERERSSGTMITDFLLNKFPTRREAVAFVCETMPVASTSDKIETIKWPEKTRVITSMCAEGRRLQGEYEHNNGKVLVHVPGFMVGLNPAERLKRTYAAIKQNLPPGMLRLYGSLDLSSFSQGMRWAVQVAINEVMFDAYGLAKSDQRRLEACTKDTYMIRAEANLRLFTVNSVGSNYEGLDGKRNTFLHCTMWYIARCEAVRRGIDGSLRAFIYIDDGAFALEVEENKVETTVKALREALITAYSEYGFKLNLSKTVISTSYMQFLNELFLHGIHIGYGFRALCHTAAQSFPDAATVCEELAVITGGIRGSGVAGGHQLRLMVGLNYILWLYTAGIVGNKGKSLACKSAYTLSLVLYLPTIAGGFGISNWTQIYSNLAGNRDAEKLDRLSCIARFVRLYYPERYADFKAYVKTELMSSRTMEADFLPDRVTVAHPGTARFGDLGRDMDIARAAKDMAKNEIAIDLLTAYLDDKRMATKPSVQRMLVRGIVSSPVNLPMALVEKVLDTDPHKAIVKLVAKISSSYLVDRLLTTRQVRSYNRLYFRTAQKVLISALDAFS